LSQPPAGSLSPAKRALLEQALERRRRERPAPVRTIPRRSATEPAPLSSTQTRMWFLAQWAPQDPTFNAVRAIRLRGALDPGALEQALAGLIERHHTLRTVVVPGREPRQRVLEQWDFALTVREGPPADAAGLQGELRALAREPFDLTRDLMMRADLFALGPDDHILLLRIHHIAADAHSDGLLFSELATLYEAARAGRPAELPVLPLAYADYAAWEQEHLSGPALEPLLDYWRGHLAGAPERLPLPADHPRPPVQRHLGAHTVFGLDAELGRALQGLARARGATFYMAALSVFATLLYRRSGEADIVIGTPIANRGALELQPVVGFFSNTVALRVGLAGNPSFAEVLARAAQSALGAYAHQELPFDRVVEALAPSRDPGYNPLFQVNFRAAERERPGLQLPGLQAEILHVDVGISRFDLSLELELRPRELAGYFEYDRDLFEPATIDGWVEDLRMLIEQVVADPEVSVLAIALPRRRAGASRDRIARRR
jgi:hypothetical protein